MEKSRCFLIGWFVVLAAPALGNPLDDLVQSLRGQASQEAGQQQQRHRGKLPDLEAMRLHLHHDTYGRLSALSADDLVEVFQALGYKDSAPRDDGESAVVFLDDPGMSTVVHGQKLRDKFSATAVLKHRGFMIGSCMDGDNHVPVDKKLAFANSWNGRKLFTKAWWHRHHGLCIEISSQLTKYDKANLELIQRCMGIFEEQHREFNTLFSVLMGQHTSRRLASPSLDELEQHLRSHGEEQHKTVRGVMPDLQKMLSEVKADEDERLADPSLDDVLSMLRALGYKDAAEAKGDHVVVFLEDPLSSVTVHQKTLKKTAIVNVFPNKRNSVTMLVCIRETMPEDQELLLLNSWGSSYSFTQPYADGKGSLCLEADTLLTKYSMANLELLQRRMSAIALMMEAFHLKIMLQEKGAGREHPPPVWQ